MSTTATDPNKEYSLLTSDGRLKLTNAEIDYLQQFLTANDRGVLFGII
ncbi:hypothetical protein ACFODO_19155 [Acinetobacter sichuanensis]|uniref:Uncharacterized protein n=1 Tax=Acinetobacter sichuanensis TaxID=2136183 RepID=A0ABV7BKU0_9GAMM|nr:hypothetical protein [Acinetobacter sichuanensis]